MVDVNRCMSQREKKQQQKSPFFFAVMPDDACHIRKFLHCNLGTFSATCTNVAITVGKLDSSTCSQARPSSRTSPSVCVHVYVKSCFGQMPRVPLVDTHKAARDGDRGSMTSQPRKGHQQPGQYPPYSQAMPLILAIYNTRKGKQTVQYHQQPLLPPSRLPDVNVCVKCPLANEVRNVEENILELCAVRAKRNACGTQENRIVRQQRPLGAQRQLPGGEVLHFVATARQRRTSRVSTPPSSPFLSRY